MMLPPAVFDSGDGVQEHLLPHVLCVPYRASGKRWDCEVHDYRLSCGQIPPTWAVDRCSSCRVTTGLLAASLISAEINQIRLDKDGL